MTKNNKRRQMIFINILLIIAGYFLYQRDTLSLEQIGIFIACGLWGINFLFFKNKGIKMISLPGLIGMGFLFLLGTAPLFKDSPDTSTFYLSQQMQYIFLGNPNNVEIKEQSEFGEQTIVPTNNQNILLREASSRTLSFKEKNPNNEEQSKLIIVFPNNTIYNMYPGSQILIEKSLSGYTITKQKGSIEFYKGDGLPNIDIKNYDSSEQKNKSDFSLSYMIDNYENLKIKYLINKAGGTIITQPFYQRISKNILKIAYQIRPDIYTKNIKNYEEYKKILGRNNFETEYKTEEKRREPVLNQIKKGQSETRVLK